RCYRDWSSDVCSSDLPSPGGCDQNPVICQSGGAPGTTTDCGQVGPGGQPASPPPPGTVCTAGGVNPGAGIPGSGGGAPQLPRTEIGRASCKETATRAE